MTYADSSVIVKRYYEEPGSTRVHGHWATGERIRRDPSLGGSVAATPDR